MVYFCNPTVKNFVTYYNEAVRKDKSLYVVCLIPARMRKIKIFISSVQAEFKHERMALNEYLLSDPLLGKFFEPFLFELLPAIDRSVDAVYLKEVGQTYSILQSL